jgi:gliding motility-associated-like protein
MKNFILLSTGFFMSAFSAFAQKTVYPNPMKCNDTSWVYTLPNTGGLVFKPKLPIGNGNTGQDFDIPLPLCYEFYSVIVDLDIKVGPWDAANPDALHNIFWLYRSQYRSNTWGNPNFKGPNANDIRMMTNLDTWPYPYTAPQLPPVSQSWQFPITVGKTYHIHFEHNTSTKKVILTCYDKANPSNTITKILNSPGTSVCYTPNNPDPSKPNGMKIAFSHMGLNNPPEAPTIGWEYRDVVVEFLRSKCPKPALVINATKTNVTCTKQGTATVAVSGGSGCYTYKWNSGPTTATITGLGPGKQVVTVTDVYGCTMKDSVTIINNSTVLTTSVTITDVRCKNGSSGGASVTVNNGTGPYTYAWSPSGGNAATASGLSANTYTVKVTDAGGCVVNTVVPVTQPAAVVSANISQSGCIGTAVATATGAGGTGPYNYSWTTTPVQTGPTATGLTTGPAYTVTITDSKACKKSIPVTINPSGQITAVAGADIVLCAGIDTLLSATGGVVYSWSPVTGLSNPNIPNPIAAPLATTTYILTVQDTTCTDTDTLIVSVNSLPTADAGTTALICPNGNTQLNATGSAGSNFSWNPSTFLSNPTAFNPTASPNVDITYTVAVTDGNGCTNYDTVSVLIGPAPVADAGSDITICPGTSSTLSASGGSTFTWNADPSLSATGIPDPVINPTNITLYIVTVSNGSCSDTDSVVVSLHPSIIANAGPDTSVCLGDSVMLQALSGSFHTWTPGATLDNYIIANPLAFPSVTTTYTVVSENIYGCADADVVTVTIKQLPIVDAGTPVSICPGSNTPLAATGPAGSSYVWTPSATLTNPNSVTPTAAPISNTTYTVFITDLSGCKNSDAVNVGFYPAPVGVGDEATGNENSTISATVLINDSYAGATVSIVSGPGNGTAMVNADGSISYTPNPNFSGTDQLTYQICDSVCIYACDTVTLLLKVIDDKVIEVPQGFSPNGDNINDLFVIEGLSSFPENELIIVNRWGDIVYKASPYRNDWNGESRPNAMKLGGDIVLDGTYFYSLKLDENTTQTSYVIIHR